MDRRSADGSGAGGVRFKQHTAGYEAVFSSGHEYEPGVDTGITDTNIVEAGVQPNGPDAGCDEDVMGESYCIINSPGGNGTPVARQNPVPYASCKL